MREISTKTIALFMVWGLAVVAPQAAVVLVEPGHVLNQLVDSAAPLHPSQTALNTGCQFASDIESIGIDKATGMLYVQLESPAASFTSLSTCIASVTPTVPGVVMIINPSTGFGINGRGTDLHFDPASGLLLTQDQNFPGDRIATVNPVGGAVGTYAPVGGRFPGATFGMDFSAGVGGSVVPAGQVVFTADVGGNGIHSTPAGGPAVTHVVPPVPGDDMVVQPSGNWVHVPDFTGVITSYSPVPPHVATPSGTGLNIQGIFTAAGLSFVHGSRATVCDTTGELYISYSGSPGGRGIFRIDPTLTMATHVLTISSEGLHDLMLGPSTSGVGNSVFFTVHDSVTGGEEVWEVTTPECAVACDPAPLTQGYWHRQCLGAGLITPGRNGRGPTEVLEPDFLKTLVPAVDSLLEQKVSVFHTCEEGMDAVPPSDPCERALKQYTALLLNLTSGRLSAGCEVDLGALGCSSTNIGDLVDELATLINNGGDDCKIAADCAGAINENQGIILPAMAAPVTGLGASSTNDELGTTPPPGTTGTSTTTIGGMAVQSTTPAVDSPAAASDVTYPPEATSAGSPTVLVVVDTGGAASNEPAKGEPDRSAEESSATPTDPGAVIDRHLSVLADPAALEDARRASEDALLTALGGGYEPELRLQIVQALMGTVDAAYHTLLARHLADIRDEAREVGDTKRAEKAERLLTKLERAMEPRR